MSLSKLKGHQRPITNLNLYNNNLLSTGKDGNMVLWDELNVNKTISCSGSISVSGVNDDIIYTGGANGILNLWDFNGNKKKEFSAIGPIKGISWSKQNNMYYILAKKLTKPESVLIILDKDLNKIKDLELDGEYNSLLQVNDNMICGGCDGLIKILNLNLDLINKIQAHKKEITNIKVDYNKKIIVSSSFDNRLIIYDINSFEIINSYKHTACILTFSIHQTDNIIAIGGGHDKMTIASSSNSGQFEIVMIDSNTCSKLFDFDSKHFGPVNCVLFHTNKNIFITGGEDGYIHYWNCDNNWIKLNTKKNSLDEYNDMKLLLSDSKKLLESLSGKNSKNQRRNLKNKIEKLELKLPIKLKEIENM